MITQFQYVCMTYDVIELKRKQIIIELLNRLSIFIHKYAAK